ncbi:MAG TPA: hypothetical protein PKM44_15000, partial [Turneriella sp.]|nr:hypothetical protein [Turneriella sp.]
MKRFIPMLLGLTLAAANCTTNSTLLSDTAASLGGASSASGSGTSTTTSGSKLWVVGGTSGALSAALSTVLSYSPDTNAWTTETTSGTYTPVS